MRLSGFIWLSPKVADLLLFGTLVHSSQPLRAVQWLTGESARRLAPWPCGELLRHNGRYKDNTYIRPILHAQVVIDDKKRWASLHPFFHAPRVTTDAFSGGSLVALA